MALRQNQAAKSSDWRFLQHNLTGGNWKFTVEPANLQT